MMCECIYVAFEMVAKHKVAKERGKEGIGHHSLVK